MSKKISWLLVAVTLFAVLAGPAVFAQSSTVVKMDVPFEFRVGGQSLPAGEYCIVPKSPTLINVRSKDGHQSAIALTNAVQATRTSNDGKLVFNRYGNLYFLAQVWNPGEDVGRKVIQSKVEQEVAAVSPSTEMTILIAGKIKK